MSIPYLISKHFLIGAFACAAMLAFLPATAQQPANVWRVGFLAPGSSKEVLYVPFVRGMSELGYVEGRNLAIEWRFAEGKIESLPGLAAELVRMKMDVTVAAGTTGAQAAQQASTSTPIVMANVGDPVASGLVKSLGRPGGNITGLSSQSTDTVAKHVELLLRVLPRLSRVALLVNPTNGGNRIGLDNARRAVQGTKVTILPVEARSVEDIEGAFSRMVREKAGAVILSGDVNLIRHRRQVAVLAAKHRLPSIAGSFGFAEEGGLMSYGVDQSDIFRRVAIYVDKILRGAKPAVLPVEQPTKFELIVNRGAAKALGLTLPQSLLISADKVIE